jgi:hypothetical protein
MSDDYEEKYKNEEYYDETMTDHERFECMVLKIHPFLAGRKVTVVSFDNTKKKGWTANGNGAKFIGKNGVVKEVHIDVHEAIKVKIDGSGETACYWHYLDLKLQMIKMNNPKPVFFNPMDLVV